MTRGVKLRNPYAEGKFYTDTPKAVFAALAFSLAERLSNGEQSESVLIEEWAILHTNGLVLQRPPRDEWS